jgi:hypothetical protein
MTIQPKRIDFDNFAANVRALFDAIEREHVPLLVERGDQLFRVEPQKTKESEDIWADYDADRVRQALRASRGALTGVDRADLLADVHAQRGQNSDGRPAD